ncbi:MAG: PEP-CTERM sorting domain-containing protein [Pirellulales bacterium]|nr:PEP-CTERM sorting domain-containing protein [Pirellulales bacterium]
MKNALSFKRVGLVVVMAFPVMILFVSSAIADVTYYLISYPADQNGWELSGSITTDGTLGYYLTGAHIKSWEFTISKGSSFYSTSDKITSLLYLQATDTQLLLPYLPPACPSLQLGQNATLPSLIYVRGPESIGQYLGKLPNYVGGVAWNTYPPEMGGTDPWIIAQTNPNPQPPTISWKGGNDDTSTAWGVGNNWSTGYVPDGPGANVQFGSQPANCPIVDMVTVGRTVGNITFSATTCTTIQSTYGFALTLDNNGSISIIDVAGSHTILTSVNINNDVKISGLGTLSLSGGISGNHALTVHGSINASSIQVDSLNIGVMGVAQAVPESSTFALLGMAAICMAVYAWRRRKRTLDT